MEFDLGELKCGACKKRIKRQVVTCSTDDGLFYHPGCASKHKIVDGSNGKIVTCPGPHVKLGTEFGEDMEVADPTEIDCSSMISGNESVSIDTKIDWLVRTVKEIKDEVTCKREIKMLIKEVVQDEVRNIRQDLEELRKMIRGQKKEAAEEVHAGRSYSEAAKKRKENIMIIKPMIEQESEITKKVIKEKVDIKNMSMGITKLRKGREGKVIMGYETGEEVKIKLKDTVQSKLGENYNVIDSVQSKPKIKVININEDEMVMKEEELIHTIKKQNSIEEAQISIIKKIWRNRNKDGLSRSKEVDGGAIILEVDEGTHSVMLKKEKLNIGWRKCRVFNHLNIKRCFKCWGFYHIAKYCKRDETCHKCAGKHKSAECSETSAKCVNCMFKIQTYNIKINDDHDALSPECPTYRRAVEEEKKRAGLVEIKK